MVELITRLQINSIFFSRSAQIKRRNLTSSLYHWRSFNLMEETDKYSLLNYKIIGDLKVFFVV